MICLAVSESVIACQLGSTSVKHSEAHYYRLWQMLLGFVALLITCDHKLVSISLTVNKHDNVGLSSKHKSSWIQNGRPYHSSYSFLGLALSTKPWSLWHLHDPIACCNRKLTIWRNVRHNFDIDKSFKLTVNKQNICVFGRVPVKNLYLDVRRHYSSDHRNKQVGSRSNLAHLSIHSIRQPSPSSLTIYNVILSPIDWENYMFLRKNARFTTMNR